MVTHNFVEGNYFPETWKEWLLSLGIVLLLFIGFLCIPIIVYHVGSGLGLEGALLSCIGLTGMILAAMLIISLVIE